MTESQKIAAENIFKQLKKLDDLGLKLVKLPSAPVELLSDLADITTALEDVAFGLIKSP